ncbi:MAG TPA: DapH/DapD/GlmU-related protein [Amnibacterium sp.]|nr:DapH/DapD/GlmU-related protein [Amnibacterium sp.]
MSLLIDLPANVRAGLPTAEARPTVPRILATMATARYAAVFLHRVAHRMRAVWPLAAAVKQLNQFLTGADIAPEAQIGAGLILYHPNGVVIGAGALLGRRCVLQQGVTVGGLGGPRSAGTIRTVLGDDVTLGAGARVIGAVEVGDRSTVGANAVVTRSVPADSVATGVPAVARPRR